MIRKIYILALLVAVMMLAACSKDDVPSVTVTEDAYTVAVILPLDDDGTLNVDGTLRMFEKNLALAQQGCSHRVKLKFEMYDEDSCSLSQLGSQLRRRSDVKAVIGPIDQNHLQTVSYLLKNSDIPLMAINAGSTEVVRSSVERGDFFWALTETDITKLEIMLTSASKMGAKRFDLICSNSGYTSQTYKDWFGFEVSELGLTVSGNYLYSATDELSDMVSQSLDEGDMSDKCIICVPDNEEEADIMFDEIYKRIIGLPDSKRPKLFCSDNVMQMSNSLPYDDMTIYTVSASCSPESGFYPGYQSATGEDVDMCTLEAQLYDALMLTSMALAEKPDSVIAALKDITDKGNLGDGDLVAWSPENMGVVFKEIEQGDITHHIAGASGPLYFDKDNHTCVTESYFVLDYYECPRFEPVAYYCVDAYSSTQSLLADWKWQQNKMQDFSDVTYKPSNTIPLDKKWAVVVASSEGYVNYRHQADALNVYQYLRENGYDDDHILLIMADDIANDPNNPKPGQVIDTNGKNLYHDVKIDYKVAQLTPQQVMDRIAELPCDSDDNVLVFWSGHGEPGYLMWGNNTISPDMVRAAQDRLNGRYRKMAWFIEACYSGCIGEALTGYDHLMVMTAANANETSKAYLYNNDVNAWISNRFTAYLLMEMKDQPYCTISELYNTLSIHTIGSHVMLYNAANYGDITEEVVME